MFNSPSDIINQLNWRYATKSFDPTKKLTPEQELALSEAARLTPSSYGLQCWKFLWVKNPELRAQLLPHSWNQKQVVEASHLMVLCTLSEFNVKYIERFILDTAQTRGVPVESLAGYKQLMIGNLTKRSPQELETWMQHQVYIALGQLMTACAVMGIDSCPMEGFVSSKYDEILGLPAKGLKSCVVLPIGFRSQTDKYATAKKVRFPKQDIILEI